MYIRFRLLKCLPTLTKKQLWVISKKMRLQHDREVKFQMQSRQSICIVVICHDVEVHENIRGEYIQQHIHFTSTCFIDISFTIFTIYAYC